MMTDIRLDDLQGEIRQLAELLGIEQALELCQLFGGDNIYIPIDCNEAVGEDIKELAEVLGAEQYEKLWRWYRGTILYFPMEQTVLKQYIARKIHEEYDGTNRRRLMRLYGLSKSRFYQIINSRKPLKNDDRQLTIMDFLM